MAVNIHYGNTAHFTVEFISSVGVIAQPTSGAITIVWIDDTGRSNNSSTVELTVSSNGTWDGSWTTPSTILVPSEAEWVLFDSRSPYPSEAGQIEIIGESLVSPVFPVAVLLTEDGEPILTEDGDPILLES